MLNDMPTVSIIIPTHNRAALLTEAIGSLIAQTYPDWEALVVDDGSTDNTRTVVQGCGDSRVHYVYQEHAERSVARNRGLAEARGEFIAFLDDDDLYLPHKLAAEIAFMTAHPEIDMTCGGTRLADVTGTVRAVARPWLEQPEPNLANCLEGRCWSQTCSILLRRSALESLDHWFESGVSITEDRDFFLRLVMGGQRVAWLPQDVSCYRVIHAQRSLHVLVDYSRAYLAMLDRLMARPDMPTALRAERDSIVLRCRFLFAAYGYVYGQVRLAQRELLHALRLAPQAATALHPIWIEALARTAADIWSVSSPAAYYDFVFANLPLPMARLCDQRERAWQVYCETHAAMRQTAEARVCEIQGIDDARGSCL